MLEAIISTSLGDGDVGDDETTRSFQEYVAELVGHKASILVMTGSMGNQVALRTCLQVHLTAFSLTTAGTSTTGRAGGAATLCGALIKGVVPSNGYHLTLEDVKKNAVVTETYYDAPTRVISLANTLAGTNMPLDDIRAIS
ncbi:hypothetical protein N8I77_002853 [Diaporthe amygdali]|uniref:Aromatic amino acid beta-eliminating lyase/threonine aldolase domain-containing protein n=1 Tax=Phomopsis amygdali TaxID=1214568 RepID=A0AAD9STK9_PHOAM|nr:hypothetical protein N8I77_002853 [Diaporthe amygdali]